MGGLGLATAAGVEDKMLVGTEGGAAAAPTSPPAPRACRDQSPGAVTTGAPRADSSHAAAPTPAPAASSSAAMPCRAVRLKREEDP